MSSLLGFLSKIPKEVGQIPGAVEHIVGTAVQHGEQAAQPLIHQATQVVNGVAQAPQHAVQGVQRDFAQTRNTPLSLAIHTLMNTPKTLLDHPAQLGHQGNPIANFAVQNIVNPALRSPGDISHGIQKSGTALGNAIFQDTHPNFVPKATPQQNASKFLSGAGQVGVGAINSPLGFLTGGAKLAEGALGGTGLLKILKEGATTGAKYAGAYGAAQGLQDGKNLPEQATKAVVGGLENAAGGALLGAGLGAGGYGIAKGIEKGVPAAINAAEKTAQAYKGSKLSDQGGYIRVGYPKPTELPTDVQLNAARQGANTDRLANDKVTSSDANKMDSKFSQTDIHTIAKNVPEFKSNPVVHFDPEGFNGGPALRFNGKTTQFTIPANQFFPTGTDISHIPKGEQVDLSPALEKGARKLPAIIESRIGKKLPTGPTPKATPQPKVAAPSVAEQLAQKAQASHQSFQDHLSSAAQEHGLEAKAGPPKSAERIAEKVANDYAGDHSRVKDLVRGTIPVPDPSNADHIVQSLRQRFGEVNVKSSLDQEGYKDLKVNVRMPDGTTGEVILATPEMLRAKHELGGHKLYKEIRVANVDDPETQAKIAQMNKLYEDAHAAAENRLASSAESSLPSNSALRGAKGAPVDTTLPTTSAPSLSSRTSTSSTSKNRGNGLPVSDSISVPSSKTLADKAENVNRERGLTTGVKGSANFTPELRKSVKSEYAPSTDQAAIDEAQRINNMPIQEAYNEILARLSNGEAPSKQLVVDAGNVMQNLDAAGKTPQAQHIHDLLAEHLTTSGQTSQAASLIYKRSAEGLYLKASADLRKAGVNVDAAMQTKLKKLKDAIKATRVDTPERQMAVANLQKFVRSNLPSSATEKLFGIWRAGLLTGVRTVGKIVTSHATHGVLEAAKDVPATGVDKLMSLVTGKRSIVTNIEGRGKGFKQGAKAGGTYLKTGVEINPGNNSAEFRQTVNFGSSVPGKVASAYTNGVGRIHGSLYKPFFGSAHLESLYNQAKAAAATEGLKGAERDTFIENFVASPPHKALDVAQKDAENFTFQQETKLGNVASALQQKGGIVGKVIAPFTRIPSAIATDLVHYSPVGGIKTIVDGIKAARSEEGWSVASQREFAQGLGRSIVGTAALLPGMALQAGGMITGEYPNDPKEQKLWTLEGKTANSIKIGGKWRSLGSLGPVGSVLAIGAKIGEGLSNGKDIGTASLDGLVAGLKSIESQSYLSGVSAVVSAAQDPGRYLGNLEKQYAGSIVPTIVGNYTSTSDPNARQVNGPIDAIKSKVPGLRQGLPVKNDAFGAPVPTPETGLGAAADPFYSSNSRPSSPVTTELRRLQNAQVGVMPSTISSNESFDGVKTTLTRQQAKDLQDQIGRDTLPLWQKAIASPEYQALTDDQKQKMLSNITTDVKVVDKLAYSEKNRLGQFSPNFAGKRSKLSASQSAISLNKQTTGSPLDIAKFVPGSSTSSAGTDPKSKYQSALDKYNSDKAAGKITAVTAATRTNSLAKLKAESGFSQDVIDFYHLSNADKSALFKSNPQQAKSLYDQAKQLDSQLVSAGLGTTKFKSPTSHGGSKVARGRGGSKTRIAKSSYKGINLRSPYGKLGNLSALHSLLGHSSIKQPSLKSFAKGKIGKAPKVATAKLKKGALA